MKKIILAFFALLLSIVLRAGDNGTVPTVAIPSDPTALTMGTVSSYGNSAFAAENNITAAAYMDSQAELGVSYSLWNIESRSNHIPSIALAYGWGHWGFALSVGTYINGSAYTLYDDSGVENGTFRPFDIKASIGVAYAFDCGVALGATLRSVYSKIHPAYKAEVPVGDLYLAYNHKYVGVVLAATNIGAPAKYSKDYGDYKTRPLAFLPMLIKAGVNVRPVKGLQISVEGDYMLNNNSWMLTAGAQYTILDIATLRASYHYGTTAAEFSTGSGTGSLSEAGTESAKGYFASISGVGTAVLPSYATVGLGFNIKGFTIDATYLFASPTLKNTVSIALGYRF